MGARGDGVVADADGAVHVPFTLPGERVQAHVRGQRGLLETVQEASADRVPAPCPHFGVCGGCALQHWSERPYLAWKAGLVVRALERAGLTADIGLAIPAWGRGRRRASFQARWQVGEVRLGFSEARSHTLVPVEACPVLTPSLAASLPQLREIAALLMPRDASVTLAVTETLTGLDVDLRGAGRVARFGRSGTERLAQAAQGLARLSLEGETAVSPAPPQVRIGVATVPLPTGAFLQATQLGEETLAAKVLAWSAGAKRIADLFAGLGTFALRLKALAPVLAVETDRPSVAAMVAGANALAGGHRLEAQERDLFRAPLAPLELKGIDTVVFDPPRAGAQGQCEQLARSKVARVIAVSCDPQSFARDAAILVGGGFTLVEAVAVDQFRWSPHVEIAARFER
jgi:23S rRNA (uracil1939-C5)-methyltransferase